MSKTVNVLIVEDEPLIVDALNRALDHISDSEGAYNFKVKAVTNCDLALEAIDNAVKSTPIDLVLLDISIPSSKDKSILCGEGIGIEMMKWFPEVKIIVFTPCSNNYRLNSILKSLDPDGFLIKSDVTFNKLLEAIDSVLKDPPYYSRAIQQLMRQHISHDFVLDKTDRQLLYYLSKGVKTKDLQSHISISRSGIERRKRHLKELFDVDPCDDNGLLLKAEQGGFI